MSSPGFILIAGPTCWRICALGRPTVEVPTSSNAAASVASAVASALKECGYRGEEVLLATPSQWCLCARVDTTGLSGRNRQQTLLYRLEDKLPVAAEDVVADFIPFNADDSETMGVAVQRSFLAPVVEAMENNGIAVAAICPLAMLSLQHLLADGAREGAFDAVLCSEADSQDLLEVFALRKSRPLTWCTLPAEPKDVVTHLAVESGDRAVTIAAINTSSKIEQAISSRTGMRLIKPDANPVLGTVVIADSILSGKTAPWLNFRRDDLAVREPFRQIRIPLRFASAAAALFLVCLGGAMLWRARQYEKLAGRLGVEQQTVFQQAFPKVPVPVDVHSRLVAEARGLAALSGGTSGAAPRERGLVTLRDVLTHLPAADALRYRVLEVRLDQGRFTIEGQALTHGDADSIAASLRNGGLFTVEPPRTEQLGNASGAETNSDKPEGIAFTITGALAAAPEGAK